VSKYGGGKGGNVAFFTNKFSYSIITECAYPVIICMKCWFLLIYVFLLFLQIAFNRDVGSTSVTLEGDIFQPSGLLTGGSRR
jgi:hypothetical protein